MDDFETRLSGLLHDRAAAARPFEQLDSVVDPFDEPVRAVAGGRSASLAGRVWRPLVGVAAATLLIVGLVAINGRDTPRNAGGPGVGSGPRFSFVTPQVSLTADDFWIEVGGSRYTSLGAQVEVHSDPGDAARETLELVWREQGHEMRLFIYFQSDGAHWSSDELRTYNAQLPEPDWVTFTGDFFRSELGSPWTGTFDQTATEGGVTSHLHMDGVRLQAFLGFRPGGVVVPTTETIAPQTDGTVVADVQADALPDTGIAWVPADTMAVGLAEQTIENECMAAKGWTLPMASVEQIAAGSGAWPGGDPMGLTGLVAAKKYGYHSDPIKANDPLEQYVAGLSSADQERFSVDAYGPGPNTKITSSDGSVAGAGPHDGCAFQARATIEGDTDAQTVLAASVRSAVDDDAAARAALDDPDAIFALAEWVTCVNAATGEAGFSTPADLARRFETAGSNVTDREKVVATADVQCQRQTDLWVVYNTALAKVERTMAGDKAADYDQLASLRVAAVARAHEYLQQHRIAVPSLD